MNYFSASTFSRHGREREKLYTCDQWVLSEITGEDKSEEDGKPKYKKVPGRIQIYKLEVGESDCSNHPYKNRQSFIFQGLTLYVNIQSTKY